MDKYLQCPNCNEDFNEDEHLPRSLPCGHPLCSHCVRKVTSTKKIKCFICFRIYSKKYLKLPVDKDRQECLQGSDSMEGIDTCEVCILPDHDNNRLRYYCYGQNCRKAICAVCALHDHRDDRNHEVTAIETAFNAAKSKCEMLLEKLYKENDKIEKISYQVDEYENKLKSFPGNVDKVLEMSETISKQSIEEIGAYLLVYRKDKLGDLAETKGKIEQLRAKIKEQIYECTKTQKCTNSLQFLHLTNAKHNYLEYNDDFKMTRKIMEISKKLDQDTKQVMDTLSFFLDEMENLNMKITSNVKKILFPEGYFPRKRIFNFYIPEIAIGWLLLCFSFGTVISTLVCHLSIALFTETLSQVPVAVYYTVIPALLPVNFLLKMIFRNYGYSYSKWIDTGYMSGRLLRFAYFAGVVTGIFTCDYYWLYYLSVYIYNNIVYLMIATKTNVSYILITPFSSVKWLLFTLCSYIINVPIQLIYIIQTLFSYGLFITQYLFDILVVFPLTYENWLSIPKIILWFATKIFYILHLFVVLTDDSHKDTKENIFAALILIIIGICVFFIVLYDMLIAFIIWNTITFYMYKVIIKSPKYGFTFSYTRLTVFISYLLLSLVSISFYVQQLIFVRIEIIWVEVYILILSNKCDSMLENRLFSGFLDLLCSTLFILSTELIIRLIFNVFWYD